MLSSRSCVSESWSFFISFSLSFKQHSYKFGFKLISFVYYQLHQQHPLMCSFSIRWKTATVKHCNNSCSCTRSRLQTGNVNTNWSELCLNLSISCPLTCAHTICTLLTLNSALNWKQYWAPGLQNEFVYDYSCPGALRAPGNVYFIELGSILFSSPLHFMSVLAQGRILIEMVWLSYKASITYRSRQSWGWPANTAEGKPWSD